MVGGTSAGSTTFRAKVEEEDVRVRLMVEGRNSRIKRKTCEECQHTHTIHCARL